MELEKANVIFKCTYCNKITRRTLEHRGFNFVTPTTLDNRGFDCRPFLLCECGKHIVGRTMKGKLKPEKRCDGRCMGSTGPNCECSCGGANHGLSYAT